ncbi:hypothetical protein ACUZXT_13415, partial [Salmonella enterica subsp. enterica serovar Paratyphi A]
MRLSGLYRAWAAGRIRRSRRHPAICASTATSSRSSRPSGLLCYFLPSVNLENHRVFQKVDAYAGDPILSLMERFKDDSRHDKV